MTVSGISASQSPTGAGDTESVFGSELGASGDEFMLMLLAQLKNQNPLEPVDNSQLMNQLTQLNSLQELEDVNTNLEQLVFSNELSYGAGLLGKTIEAIFPDGRSMIGDVEKVTHENGRIQIQVNGQMLDLAAVQSIRRIDELEETP
jgi:flagellar basal-body rod modification protein FlgD